MPADIPSANPPPHVVLIHGIWDNARTLLRLDEALGAAGFGTTMVTLSPNDARIPLGTYAAQVHQQTEAALADGRPYAIVGFSMGGLVARAFLRDHGDPARLRTFVSIASPHRGTWTAYLRRAPGVCDMRPGSAFLRELDADASRFASTRWVTIRTPLDLMILPSGSSCLPWAQNHCHYVPLHPLMVRDRRVINAVISSLRD